MFNKNNFISKLSVIFCISTAVSMLPGCASLSSESRSFSDVLGYCLSGGAVLFLVECVLLEIGTMLKNSMYNGNPDKSKMVPTFIIIAIIFMFSLISFLADAKAFIFLLVISALLSFSVTAGIYFPKSYAYQLIFIVTLCAAFGMTIIARSF